MWNAVYTLIMEILGRKNPTMANNINSGRNIAQAITQLSQKWGGRNI